MKGLLPEFNHRHVIFIGRGREGQSFERFLEKRGNAASFRFIDEQDGPDYLEALTQADLKTTVVVKTPGCPGSKVPVPYTTATNVFFSCVRQLGATLIGVTGTKGKSTTATMIGAVLREGGLDAVVCGNIGVPMLEVLDRKGGASLAETVFVVELSSYQLADMTVSPDVAVITNLYEDHVPYHGSLEAYWEAKHNILRYMGRTGMAVYNPDFARVKSWVETSSCRGIRIDPQAVVDMADWKIWGDHNRLNALLAIRTASLFGVPEAKALNALRELDPLPHRMQSAGLVKGVIFIDNAIGGNPAATLSAIAAVRDAGKTLGCLIAGGVDRNQDFTELGRAISVHRIPCLVLLPDTGRKIRDALPGSFKGCCYETDDIRDAVRWAVENCPSGTVCLLSPASPTQTLAKDFEDLGNKFSGAVRDYV